MTLIVLNKIYKIIYYILSFKVLYITGVKHNQSFKTEGLGYFGENQNFLFFFTCVKIGKFVIKTIRKKFEKKLIYIKVILSSIAFILKIVC